MMTVAVRFNTDDYGALFVTCLGTEPVQSGLNRFHVGFFFFSGTFERSHGISMFTKRNTIPHFHPASTLKPSGRMFVHAAEKNVAVHVSYTTHITSLHYIENFSTYVVSCRHLHIAYFTTSLHEHREIKRSRSKTPPLSRTFERSHGIFHNTNTARSKGQGQTSFPAKCEISSVSTYHISHTLISISFCLYCQATGKTQKKSANFQHAKLPICKLSTRYG